MMITLDRKRIIIFYVGFAIWLAIVIASGAGWNPLHAQWNFSNPGAFGDSFGPISALMALIAAVSAIAAFKEQKDEINRLRIRQLEEDRRRDDAFIHQTNRENLEDIARNKLAFEGTFFQLLSTLRTIVASTDMTTSSGTKTGQDAFRVIVRAMESAYTTNDNATKSWKEVAHRYSNDLNHYFRFLYHVIKFTDSSDFIDRYFYIRLVRSMLSESELILLSLNGAYGEGSSKFKPLMEKYALLHNISSESRSFWLLDSVFTESAFEYIELQ